VAGVGAGNYTVRFEPYGDRVGSPAPDYDDPGEERFPHSLPLEIAAETGLLGLGLVGALVVAAGLAAWRASRAFARGGATAEAMLARALGLGLLGYLSAGLFLHLRFERQLWLLLGLIAALPGLARRTAGGSASPAAPDLCARGGA
jgi:O-antigen ligase